MYVPDTPTPALNVTYSINGDETPKWAREVMDTFRAPSTGGCNQYIAFDYKASVQCDPMCGPISPTLEAQDKTAITTRWGVRRLTPVEVERLQSMPDGWTDVNGMADTHRYRFMGNGGTANKLRWIAERLKGAL